MIQSSLYDAFKNGFKASILITKDSMEAHQAYQVAKFCEKKTSLKPILFPDFRARMGDDMRSFVSEFSELLVKLREFYNSSNPLLISPISSLLYPLPRAELLQSFVIQKNTCVDISDLKNKLLYYGYENVDIVSVEGEVSFRGDIIDIFPPFSSPYRIAFFDNECESIRCFDPDTQISEKTEYDFIDIPPALFSLNQEQYNLLNEQISQSDFDAFSKDISSLGFWFLQEDGINFVKTYESVLSIQALQEAKEIFDLENGLSLNLKDFTSLRVLDIPKNGSLDIEIDKRLLDSIIELNANKSITLLGKNQALFKNLTLNKSVNCMISDCIINISTPTELIISLNTYTKIHKQKKTKIGIDELNIGEYVVHDDYGIGIFKGIAQNTVLGSVRDFIEILYQGQDKLLLPVENLHMIQRYIAPSGSIPVMDKLGKGSFAKLKEKVKIKLFEIADAIIQLAAQRDIIEGKRIDVSLPEIETFKNSCNFVLTNDQERSIKEIFADISSGKVMDRLLSGDVGFGKTEVALNAIFAVYKSGYQSALIVPTTLLCNQHFNTLKKRLESFGIRVAKLDRFVKSHKNQILKQLLDGDIDVIVGTHSLLNARFKNLGLIVVDEEHKFGVKQKENIKDLSKDSHLLSMSATPIPRTLNMALSQIKGMSSLLIPPTQKQPNKTFVKENTPALLKEIIHRELRRNGQVFYIHNNIATIDKIKKQIQELVPNLKIAILHSQIHSEESEDIMIDFADGKYHMLLCTSIVESGIHLPNANTIIINEADKFGLADLHQLRGRVGRGNKEGFCYFLVNEKKTITEEAQKRLLALEKNSYLGSGASIAYHDLEIRGGGNLIGQAQSGHIKNIGYGLYLRMLEEAITQLSGSNIQNPASVDIKLSVSAYLNPELIISDRLRLELYRRLSLCKEIAEVYEIEGEIEDRFGKPDIMTLQFLQIIMIKILANSLQIKAISNYAQNITIIYNNDVKETILASSKDDDDILNIILETLRKKIPKQTDQQDKDR
ncbi:transcription-repair coupling factor [Helicobacter cappadocius]|uniref:Transcription-repair-coupling factor n=1 Tax=Helicobacter cappadocius TaxID=3063998 RepID=A0AA90T9X3_9HELI|nr:MULTISPECIES: transcription-repair coupling factor [unclassified Helicobacter]MDO7253419.1 transcription-repair coupling factor [Helicobacter sp. faydin-H75]MDP2539317.1 transcription-repair coupling factor [Helicobacter sp. faydin-H76]